MLQLERVCVPITLACNMNCVYCMRNLAAIRTHPDINELFIDYLNQLSAETTVSVIVTGGEPLLEPKKIRTVFDNVRDPGIRKKIITNGTLLTEEFVEYCNANRIEVMVSHDGRHTEALRGVDVFAIPEILRLIKKIHYLNISSVITALDPDVLAVRQYIRSVLDRDDLLSAVNTVNILACPDDSLIREFDYETFAASYAAYDRLLEKRFISKYYRRGSPALENWKSAPVGLNVLPDGSVAGMDDLFRYGDVSMTRAELSERIRRAANANREFCTSDCECRARCRIMMSPSEHMCRIEKTRRGLWNDN